MAKKNRSQRAKKPEAAAEAPVAAETVETPAAEPEICLRPSCGRVVQSRGLCATCYHTVLRLVKNGEVTWERMEAEGKVKAARQRTARNVITSFFRGDPAPAEETVEEEAEKK